MLSVVLALTFSQELIKEVLGAVATAVFVTIAGSLAVNGWSRRRDERRQRFELRNEPLERTSRLAQGMYTKCQHTRRVLRMAKGEAREVALYFLDETYLSFAPAAQALEFELGARYEFTGPDAAASRDVSQGVWEGWHQIRDLLTVYYFNLRDDFPDAVLRRNSRGYDDGFDSGIDLQPLQPLGGVSSAMRKAIRKAYEPALRRLVEQILSADIVTEKRPSYFDLK